MPRDGNAISFIDMKRLNLAYLGGGMMMAMMALAVYVGCTNACHHNAETAEQTSTDAPRKAGEKAEVEA